MFQYAVGRCLAARNSDDLFLDLTFLLDRTPRKKIVFRDYDLDALSVTPRLTLLSRLARAFPIPVLYLCLSQAISKCKNALGAQRYVEEGAFAFHRDVLESKGNLYLRGYWQSAKYFEAVESTIREEFTPPAVSAATRKLGEVIQSCNAVCVHVRRGDFVSLPISIASHGFVGLEYYVKGAELIMARVSHPHFFVFSDEIEWCTENLKFHPPATYVSHEYAGHKSTEHLWLMSQCKHFLISNSTFAWWPAWLAENKDKVVIAPRRWFRAAEGMSADDLIPESWIRI